MRTLGIFSGNHSDGMTGYFDYGNNDDLRLFEMGSPASSTVGEQTNQIVDTTSENIAVTLNDKKEEIYSVPAFS